MKKIIAAIFIVSAVICRAEEKEVRQLDSVFMNAPKVFAGAQVVRVDSSASPGIVLSQESKPKEKPPVLTPEQQEEERKRTGIGLMFGGAAFAISMGIAIAAFGWGAVMLLIVALGIGGLFGFCAVGLYDVLKEKK